MPRARSSFAVLLLVAVFFQPLVWPAHGDELNERIRQAREREEGAYNQLKHVNDPLLTTPMGDPFAADRAKAEEYRAAAAQTRAQAERQTEVDRQRAENQATLERNERTRIRNQLLEDESKARRGDFAAISLTASRYLFGQLDYYGFPRDLAKAEQYLCLATNKSKPFQIYLGGVRYLRHDSDGARAAWNPFYHDIPTLTLSLDATLAAMGARLQETGPEALNPEQQKIISGVLAGWGSEKLLIWWDAPMERYQVGALGARPVWDAWAARPELAPASEELEQFRKALLNDTAFHGAFSSGMKADLAPSPTPPPVIDTDMFTLWAFGRIADARSLKDLDVFLKEFRVIFPKQARPVREPLTRLFELTARKLGGDAGFLRKGAVNIQAVCEEYDTPAYNESRCWDSLDFLRNRAGWPTNQGGDEILRQIRDLMFHGLRNGGVKLPPEEVRFLYPLGLGWLNDTAPDGNAFLSRGNRDYYGKQLISYAALCEAAEPRDGREALQLWRIPDEFLRRTNSGWNILLKGCTNGPDELREGPLREVASREPATALSMVEPLANKGVPFAVEMMSQLTYPCAENLTDMQRALKWKLAACGQGSSSGRTEEIEKWLRDHNAMQVSYSPGLRAALAALKAAQTAPARHAALEQLGTVVGTEAGCGSYFAYEELQQLARSRADDGWAAWQLYQTMTNGGFAASTERTRERNHDAACCLVRAAAHNFPAATDIFRQPTNEDFSESFSPDDLFDSIEPQNHDALLAFLSTADAKDGPGVVAALQASLKEPPTIERLVGALHHGMQAPWKAFGYPFHSKCLDTLTDVAAQAEASPAAWQELLTALRQCHEAPFHWTADYGEFSGELYATYFSYHRALEARQSGDVELNALSTGKSPGQLACFAFTIGQNLEWSPMVPNIAYLHDEALGARLLDRAIGAGLKNGDELRRRYQEKIYPAGAADFALLKQGQLWPLPKIEAREN